MKPIEVRTEIAVKGVIEDLALPEIDCPIEEGHTSNTNENHERIVIEGNSPGGQFVAQGNNKVRLDVVVITDSNPVEGEAETPIERHGKRLNQLEQIFIDRPALMALINAKDPSIRVDSFFPAPGGWVSGRKENNFVAGRSYNMMVSFTGN